MKFCDVLNKYFNLVGCSSKDLAIETKLSESIISRYKNGGRIPNNTNLKKISKALEKLSNKKYKMNDIYEEFNCVVDSSNMDFEIVRINLNILINTFNINVRELAKALNFDASYLSRIRSGERVPSNKEEFVNSLITFILKKYDSKLYSNTFNELIENEITAENLKQWVLTNKNNEVIKIEKFLYNLDDFDLNQYIKAIKFDKLKVPNVPFYKAKCRNYYGVEEMKTGELDFFKATVLSKNREDIFMCSDMPMEDMAKDIEFGKKWMFAIAMCLKKGLHLNIIHNLDRPFNEMMLGLESWIPIYMTGQISPYYLKSINTNVYHHFNYVSGVVALTGECIDGAHNKGKYYLTNNSKEVGYYREKSKLLLKKANSLMDIYDNTNENDFKKFRDKDKKIIGDRKRILASLPLFTMSNDLLKRILKHNNIEDEDIKSILKYKEYITKNTLEILENSTITDFIQKFDKSRDCYLELDEMFYRHKVKYDYDEYIEHLNMTKKIARENKNYKLEIGKNKTFKNISISILEDKYVIISKSFNPVIHFVIRHPKLVSAISEFRPPVVEDK